MSHSHPVGYKPAVLQPDVEVAAAELWRAVVQPVSFFFPFLRCEILLREELIETAALHSLPLSDLILASSGVILPPPPKTRPVVRAFEDQVRGPVEENLSHKHYRTLKKYAHYWCYV